MKALMKDPLNLLCVGVAGQGNVVISLLISNALVREGYLVTFGQVYTGNQRGGQVYNYVRTSADIQCSSLVPQGQADIILALEPMEALRMLGLYGNPNVITVVNPRPIYTTDIAMGRGSYPDVDELLGNIKKLSARTLIVKATEEAQKLGDVRAANVILVGALIGSGTVPLEKKSIEPLLRERFPRAVDINMKALSRGMELAKSEK